MIERVHNERDRLEFTNIIQLTHSVKSFLACPRIGHVDWTDEGHLDIGVHHRLINAFAPHSSCRGRHRVVGWVILLAQSLGDPAVNRLQHFNRQPLTHAMQHSDAMIGLKKQRHDKQCQQSKALIGIMQHGCLLRRFVLAHQTNRVEYKQIHCRAPLSFTRPVNCRLGQQSFEREQGQISPCHGNKDGCNCGGRWRWR